MRIHHPKNKKREKERGGERTLRDDEEGEKQGVTSGKKTTKFHTHQLKKTTGKTAVIQLRFRTSEHGVDMINT
jgi:hypothetical protein